MGEWVAKQTDGTNAPSAYLLGVHRRVTVSPARDLQLLSRYFGLRYLQYEMEGLKITGVKGIK